MAAQRARARVFAAASQARPRLLAAPLLAAKCVRVRPRSGDARARTFVAAPLGCARPSAAAPPVVARRLRDGLPAASRLRALVSPCVQGANASDLAAAALSASPAGSTPAVLSARAGAAPTTGNASPRSCSSTLEGSTSSASAFSATPAGPKGSMTSRITGESPNADTPPDSCRSSVVCRSMAAPSPHDKSRTRVSSGDGKGENEDRKY